MFIPISLALLALSAGMFLLAKTNKEDLGRFFKVISFFIIICSFLVMGLTVVRGFTKMILHKAHKHERTFYPGHRMHHRFFNRENHHMRMHPWNSNNEENNMPEYENEHHQPDFGNGRHHNNEFRDHNWPENNTDDRVERMSDRFSKTLDLNAEQINKLKEILKGSFQKENEIRTQTKGDMEQFRKLSKENRQNRMEAIKKILTPEQLKLFNEQESRRKDEGHKQP